MEIPTKVNMTGFGSPEFSGPVHDRLIVKWDGAIVLLLLVLGAFQAATVQRLESFGPDSSVYITLANNLLETGRYEFDYEPHTRFPPCFPFLLACISVIAGSTSYGVFVRFMPIFSTLALVVWYFVLRRYAGRPAAGASCLLVATSAPLFQLVTQAVLSEAPFFLLSGLALWCLIRLERQNTYRPPLFLPFMCTCLFAGATVLTRSVGVALCAGMLVWAIAALWHRGPKRIITLRAAIFSALVGFLLFALWTGWSKHTERLDYQGQHMKSYASQFIMKDPHRPELGKASVGDMVVRIASNVPVQSSQLTTILTRIRWIAPIWYSPLTVLPFVLLLCGLASCVYDYLGPLLAGYFVAYFAIYLLWPFDEGARFMLPISPLAFVLIWRGLIALGNSLRARPVTTLAFISMSGAVLTVGIGLTHHLPGLQAQASMVFWPVFTVLLATLTFLAQRAGSAKAANTLDSIGGLIPSYSLKVIVVLMCAVGVFQQAAISRTNQAPDPSLFSHYPAADCALWLRTAGEGVVMAGQWAILHRLTARRVVSFPITSDPQVIVEVVRRENIRYLVVEDHVKDEYFFPPEEDRYQQIERAYSHMFELVHSGPGYRVFEKRRTER
jgi:hypothetical protein